MFRRLVRRALCPAPTAPIRRRPRLTIERLDDRLAPAVVAQWTFNSSTADANYATGSTAPAVGSGSLTTVGGLTTSFNLGSINNGSSDPSGDNTGLNVVGFPAQGQGNRTAGLAFTVDTRGYDRIGLSFDQRNSNTASNTEVVQVSADGGVTWADAHTFVMGGGEGWETGRAVDLSGMAGAADNPALSVRIVSTFNWAGYAASNPGSTYGTRGTWRFDMLTVSGEPLVVSDSVSVSVTDAAGSPAVPGGMSNVEGTATYGFWFARTGTAGDLPVTVDLAGTTATVGDDYAPISVVIPNGSDHVFVPVDAKRDNLVEGQEVVRLRVTDGTGYAAASGDAVEVLITDDPPVVWIESAPASVAEGQTGIVTLHRIGGRLDADLPVALKLTGVAASEYTLNGLTADADGNVSITVPATTDFVDLVLAVVVDNQAEGDQSLHVEVTGRPAADPGYVAGVPGAADITLADQKVVWLELVGASDVNEGELRTLLVHRSEIGASASLTVRLSVSADDGNPAVTVDDPTGTVLRAGTLEVAFPPDVTTVAVNLLADDDEGVEPTQGVKVAVEDAGGFAKGMPAEVNVKVVDRKPAPQLPRINFDSNNIPPERVIEMARNGLALIAGGETAMTRGTIMVPRSRPGQGHAGLYLDPTRGYTHLPLAYVGDLGPDGRLRHFILAPVVTERENGANPGKLYTYRIAKVVPSPDPSPDEWAGVAYRVLYDPVYAGQAIANYKASIAGQEEADAEVRNANLALALIHMVPLGAAVDNANQGDWGEARLSVAGDLTMVLGVGAAFKTGRAATVLMRASQAGEVGIAGVRVYQGVRDINSGKPEEGYAKLGEAALRLIGVAAPEVIRLGATGLNPYKVTANGSTLWKRFVAFWKDETGAILGTDAAYVKTLFNNQGKAFPSTLIDEVNQMPVSLLAKQQYTKNFLNGRLTHHGLDVSQLTAAEQAELLKIAERMAPATGNWGVGSYSTSVESLVDHFVRHGREVGATTVEQYLRKAEQFASNLSGATPSPVAGATPGVVRYKKSGLYIDLGPDGSIISYGKQ